MATCMTFRGTLQCLTWKAISIQPVRFRYKPPDKTEIVYPSFSQRVAEWNSRYESAASQGVNIGFNFQRLNRSKSFEKVKKWTESRQSREQHARHGQLKVDLETMKHEWNTESMPVHVQTLAHHFGIFRDLFDGAHFFPVVPLDVHYDYDEIFTTPVYHGNIIPAAETSIRPFVCYEAAEDSLWTLVLSSPDGNLEDNSQELLHWAVGNIPGNAVDKGYTICDYLQPFPAKGVGFLRYVFVLYKQHQLVDFKDMQKPPNCLSLKERSFSTLEFYQQHEDILTPAGLAFFQSQWDKSVTSVFHHTLDMKEPVFEFIHPPFYVQEQEAFPHKQPFNLYLDAYRDVKDIQEEVLKEKLKSVDPSKPPAPKPEFPSIDRLPMSIPTWLRTKIQSQRLGHNQWKDLHEDKD